MSGVVELSDVDLKKEQGASFPEPADVADNPTVLPPSSVISLMESVSLTDNGRPGIPQPGMSVVFQNITYSVINNTNRNEEIKLLRNISGCFYPSEMVAMMGPSGCGKSTLLDVLAKRKSTGRVEGTLLYGGKEPTQSFLRKNVGYVEQQDTLLGMLTVYEMLLYTVELKTCISVSRGDKEAKAEKLVEQLGLTKCRDTRIGSSLARGISGGQARRVSIGLALVTQPAVLFLDEPTSGLDAATSNEVIRIVRDLALRESVAICCTIHTPTSFCFQQFDKLLLMVRGQLVYFGPRGEEALNYFETLNFTPTPGESEAESVLDYLVRIEAAQSTAEVANGYKSSGIGLSQEGHVEKLVQEAKTLRTPAGGAEDSDVATTTPAWHAFCTFFRVRTLRKYTMLPFLGPRVLDKIAFAILLSFLYWQQGKTSDLSSLVNMSALCFMWVVIPAFGAVAYTPSISLERPLFVRERNDGLFTTSTYLFCKMTEELLILIVFTVIDSLIVFYCVGLKGSFVLFWLVHFVAASISVAFAYLVAGASPNLDVANAVVPAFMMVMLFFAGFLVLLNDITWILRWIAYIDFIRYGFGALMINHWGNDQPPILEFGEDQRGPNVSQRVIIAFVEDLFGLPSGSVMDGVDVLTEVTLGDVILKVLGFSGQSEWASFGFLCIFLAIFIFGAWLALRFSKLTKR